MTTIIPPNHNFASNQAVATQSTITVDLPPQSLIQLPPGSLINAKLVANTPDGNKQIESIFGRLTIITNLEFPINSTLELQVIRYQPQLQLI
ncbi:hypothetical protein OAJ93_03600, partial [Gammaproteobacteria bacterium]|nr:hypothetical protein [Gammaproteobacteria bacterium]